MEFGSSLRKAYALMTLTITVTLPPVNDMVIANPPRYLEPRKPLVLRIRVYKSARIESVGSTRISGDNGI